MRYSITSNCNNELGKICFQLRKMKLSVHCEFCACHRIFALRKGSEYLYLLFNVFPKQTTCEMKTLQVQVYIQQWLQDEQGAKFI